MTENTGKIAGKTLFITDASRGIGKEIALKAAKDGANVVITSKDRELNTKLPDTLSTVVREIEKAGGNGLPCMVDVRDASQIQSAIERVIKKFGGIDIVVNNASAISLTKTGEIEMNRYDLMHSINTRRTLLVSKLCLPYLKKSCHAHILNISPPISMNPEWFASHVTYTMTKYGMSMCALGMHQEFGPFDIAVNALWPKIVIDTAADEAGLGKDINTNFTRKSQIMADAAYCILTQEPKPTGQFFIDEEVLINAGIFDMEQYAVNPMFKDQLLCNLFVDEKPFVLGKGTITHKKTRKGKKIVASESRYNSLVNYAKEGRLDCAFRVVASTLSSRLVEEIQAVYQFIVTGEETGTWYIDLMRGSGSCGKGEPPQNTDVVATMGIKCFFDILLGKIAPTSAFARGILQINGNMSKALKLDEIMRQIHLKLHVE